MYYLNHDCNNKILQILGTSEVVTLRITGVMCVSHYLCTCIYFEVISVVSKKNTNNAPERFMYSLIFYINNISGLLVCAFNSVVGSENFKGRF